MGFTRSGVERRKRLHRVDVATELTFLTAERREPTEGCKGDPGHGPFFPWSRTLQASMRQVKAEWQCLPHLLQQCQRPSGQ